MSLGLKTLSGASWMIGSQMLVRVIGIFSTFILARLLTPTDFGLLALMVAVKEIVGLLFSFGPYSYLIREKEIDERKYNTAFTLNVIRGFVIGFVIISAAYPISLLMENDKLLPILLVGSIGSFANGFTNPGMAMYTKQMKFGPGAMSAFYGRLISIGATLILAIIMENYWALIIGSVVASFAEVGLGYVLHPHRPRFTLYKVREMLSFTIWISLGAIPTALAVRIDTFTLERFVGSAAVGLFSTAAGFSRTPMDVLVGVSSKVFYSTFSAIHEGKDRQVFVYMELVGVIMAFLTPLQLGLAICASEIVRIGFGAQWLQMIPLVEILPLLFLFQLLTVGATSQVMKEGRTKLLTVRGFVLLFSRLPLLVGGGILYGFQGVVAGYIAASLFVILYDLIIVRTVLPISTGYYVSRLWRPALSGAAMAATCILAVQLVQPPSNVTALLLKIGVGAAVYPLVTFLLWRLAGSPQGPERRVLTLARMAIAKRKSNTATN